MKKDEGRLDDFFTQLKDALEEDYNFSVTEKGALGFKSTGKALLDLNFAVSSLRSAKANEVIREFAKCYYADKLSAIKWLFYAGDVREGLGERRLLRICLCFIAHTDSQIAKALVPLIAEYSRWDNLLYLLYSPAEEEVVKIIDKQLKEDIKNMQAGKPCSLLAKWLPSENASSELTKAFAKRLIEKLKTTGKEYRKTLSALRKYLKVIEVLASDNDWTSIDYSAVPSKANLIYANAFIRHDEKRRLSYLQRVEEGEEKINAEVLFPHEVVHRYSSHRSALDYNQAYEQLWRALPDYVAGDSGTICVIDGSGSMLLNANNTTLTFLQIATGLGIYFAERLSGPFKDKFITFSENPQLIDLSACKSLRDKIGLTFSHYEVANTNIEAVFDLILATAIKGSLSQDKMPKNILIISDMEFDQCAEKADGLRIDKRLFEVISAKFEEKGYSLPKLIFWNLGSRSRTIPIKENELGVCLVSGFSPVIAEMILSDKLDPLDALMDKINEARYSPIENAIKRLIK